MSIITVDLKFMGLGGEIATYVITHSKGVILIDPGPESTLPALLASLNIKMVTPQQVTDVLITHIHLDHSGSAGWFAEQGATVHVHPAGARHLENPEKLMASAARLYGNQMDKLWGKMKPIQPSKLKEVGDSEYLHLSADDILVEGLHTPGHAIHHISYIYKDTIFSGDVGGVRYNPNRYLRLPFVPPETNLEEWRNSLLRMKDRHCAQIAPTHFGIFQDADAHLEQALESLNALQTWLLEKEADIRDIDTMKAKYAEWLADQVKSAKLDESDLGKYERGSPVSFAATGLYRYLQNRAK
jgi:glyoxylase-like metal-dependent hydrolase (beta-lactamase superfamily II)